MRPRHTRPGGGEIVALLQYLTARGLPLQYARHIVQVLIHEYVRRHRR